LIETNFDHCEVGKGGIFAAALYENFRRLTVCPNQDVLGVTGNALGFIEFATEFKYLDSIVHQL
jgi:hypothetical protein